MIQSVKPIRVLCLSRNYPNDEMLRLGMWVERLVAACAPSCETKVVAPVPWFPATTGFSRYSRHARVAAHEWRRNAEVFHPRFLLPPGMLLHRLEAAGYYAGVRDDVTRLRNQFPFDLIHAHFVYPDGVVATRFGEELGVPVVITEHASWSPWLENHGYVRKAALGAAGKAAKVIAVSRSLARTMESFGVPPEKIVVVPNVVDENVFNLAGTDACSIESTPKPRLLFVGIMRHVKGLDVLLKALRLVLDSGTAAELAIVGESFYASYQRDVRELRTLVSKLSLENSVKFLGGMEPHAVAQEMRRSTALVLPSRRETFGVVLAEALACGTPVIATRCGGPEDIVEPGLGILVEPDDAESLAGGIANLLAMRADYDPEAMSRRSLERFGSVTVGGMMRSVYENALARKR